VHFYAHDLSFHANLCYNGAHRTFVYFVSQKNTILAPPSAVARGHIPLTPYLLLLVCSLLGWLGRLCQKNTLGRVMEIDPQIPVYTQSIPGGSHHFPPSLQSPSQSKNVTIQRTKLYCLVTEAHRCEQLAQGCYEAMLPPVRIERTT